MGLGQLTGRAIAVYSKVCHGMSFMLAIVPEHGKGPVYMLLLGPDNCINAVHVKPMSDMSSIKFQSRSV
jgi:hypothetical protein